jgi:hypothetical protein
LTFRHPAPNAVMGAASPPCGNTERSDAVSEKKAE